MVFTSLFCAAQVDVPFLDFLRPTLVPVIQTDVAAGSTSNIHFALVCVAAVGTAPNQLAMLILDNLNFLIPTTALAVVGLGVELGVHDVVVDVPQHGHDRRDVVGEVGNLDVTDSAGKYPRVELLWNMQTSHEFILSFVTRIVNVLPSDILSLYMGAVGIGYTKYLAGSILGMLLSIITFPIMGMNIMNPGSPAFIASICIQAVVSTVSIGGFWIYYRKNRGRGKGETKI